MQAPLKSFVVAFVLDSQRSTHPLRLFLTSGRDEYDVLRSTLDRAQRYGMDMREVAEIAVWEVDRDLEDTIATFFRAHGWVQ